MLALSQIRLSRPITTRFGFLVWYTPTFTPNPALHISTCPETSLPWRLVTEIPVVHAARPPTGTTDLPASYFVRHDISGCIRFVAFGVVHPQSIVIPAAVLSFSFVLDSATLSS